ncbi:MAG: hypothetical protein SGI92_26255 [Bryobacteraceae bacterium]|nr:hypothetical protein [Bryobacteraceae bacterium]
MKPSIPRNESLLFRPSTSRQALSLIAGILFAMLPGQTVAVAQQKSDDAYLTLRDATPTAGAIAILDTRRNRVVATVPVGPGPNGMVVTSDGKTA